jgi:hypothetical protein
MYDVCRMILGQQATSIRSKHEREEIDRQRKQAGV